MASIDNKPIYFYNQDTVNGFDIGWYYKEGVDSSTFIKINYTPTIPKDNTNFAGIGIRKITPNGVQAIIDVFENSVIAEPKDIITKIDKEIALSGFITKALLHKPTEFNFTEEDVKEYNKPTLVSNTNDFKYLAEVLDTVALKVLFAKDNDKTSITDNSIYDFIVQEFKDKNLLDKDIRDITINKIAELISNNKSLASFLSNSGNNSVREGIEQHFNKFTTDQTDFLPILLFKAIKKYYDDKILEKNEEVAKAERVKNIFNNYANNSNTVSNNQLQIETPILNAITTYLNNRILDRLKDIYPSKSINILKTNDIEYNEKTTIEVKGKEVIVSIPKFELDINKDMKDSFISLYNNFSEYYTPLMTKLLVTTDTKSIENKEKILKANIARKNIVMSDEQIHKTVIDEMVKRLVIPLTNPLFIVNKLADGNIHAYLASNSKASLEMNNQNKESSLVSQKLYTLLAKNNVTKEIPYTEYEKIIKNERQTTYGVVKPKGVLNYSKLLNYNIIVFKQNYSKALELANEVNIPMLLANNSIVEDFEKIGYTAYKIVGENKTYTTLVVPPKNSPLLVAKKEIAINIFEDSLNSKAVKSTLKNTDTKLLQKDSESIVSDIADDVIAKKINNKNDKLNSPLEKLFSTIESIKLVDSVQLKNSDKVEMTKSTMLLVDDKNILKPEFAKVVKYVTSKWLFENGSKTVYNEDKALKRMLGISEDVKLSYSKSTNFFRKIGHRQQYMIDNISNEINKIIKLSPVLQEELGSNTDISDLRIVDELVSTLALIAIHSMSVSNMLTETALKTGEVAGHIININGSSEFTELRPTNIENAESLQYFYTINDLRKTNTQLWNAKQAIIELKEFKNTADLLMGDKDFDTIVYTEPPTTNTSILHSPSNVKASNKIAKAITKLNNTKYVVSDALSSLHEIFKDTGGLKYLLGYTLESDMIKMTEESSKGKNIEIDRTIDSIREYAKLKNIGIYFNHRATVTKRMIQMGNGGNTPQANKFLRNFLDVDNSNVNIPFNYEKSHYEFKEAIAQAHGAKLKKMYKNEIEESFGTYIAEFERDTYNDIDRLVNNKELSKEDKIDLLIKLRDLMEDMGEETYSLRSLFEMYNYINAKNNNTLEDYLKDTKFTIELDSTTNGLAIQTMMYFSTKFFSIAKGQLERLGIFLKNGSNHISTVAMFKNSNDIYQHIISKALEFMNKNNTISKEVNEFLVEVYGEYTDGNKGIVVSSKYRALAKLIIMPIQYGASVKASLLSLSKGMYYDSINMLADTSVPLAKRIKIAKILLTMSGRKREANTLSELVNGIKTFEFTPQEQNKIIESITDSFLPGIKHMYDSELAMIGESRKVVTDYLSPLLTIFSDELKTRLEFEVSKYTIQTKETDIDKIIAEKKKYIPTALIKKVLDEMLEDGWFPQVETADGNINLIEPEMIYRNLGQGMVISPTMPISTNIVTGSNNQKTMRSTNMLGVGMLPYGINSTVAGVHSIDAVIASITMLNTELSMNYIFDAFMLKLGNSSEIAKDYNGNLFNIATTYNLVTSITKAIDKVLNMSFNTNEESHRTLKENTYNKHLESIEGRKVLTSELLAVNNVPSSDETSTYKVSHKNYDLDTSLVHNTNPLNIKLLDKKSLINAYEETVYKKVNDIETIEETTSYRGNLADTFNIFSLYNNPAEEYYMFEYDANELNKYEKGDIVSNIPNNGEALTRYYKIIEVGTINYQEFKSYYEDIKNKMLKALTKNGRNVIDSYLTKVSTLFYNDSIDATDSGMFGTLRGFTTYSNPSNTKRITSYKIQLLDEYSSEEIISSEYIDYLSKKYSYSNKDLKVKNNYERLNINNKLYLDKNHFIENNKYGFDRKINNYSAIVKAFNSEKLYDIIKVRVSLSQIQKNKLDSNISALNAIWDKEYANVHGIPTDIQTIEFASIDNNNNTLNKTYTGEAYYELLSLTEEKLLEGIPELLTEHYIIARPKEDKKATALLIDNGMLLSDNAVYHPKLDLTKGFSSLIKQHLLITNPNTELLYIQESNTYITSDKIKLLALYRNLINNRNEIIDEHGLNTVSLNSLNSLNNLSKDVKPIISTQENSNADNTYSNMDIKNNKNYHTIKKVFDKVIIDNSTIKEVLKYLQSKTNVGDTNLALKSFNELVVPFIDKYSGILSVEETNEALTSGSVIHKVDIDEINIKVSNATPINSNEQSPVQVYVHELIHTIADRAIDLPANTFIRSQLFKLYTLSRTNATPEIFLSNVEDIESAKALAIAQYNTIYNNSKPSHGLNEFITYSLTNPQFAEYLSSLSDISAPNGLVSKIVYYTKQLLDSLVRRILGYSKKDKDIQKEVHTLVAQLNTITKSKIDIKYLAAMYSYLDMADSKIAEYKARVLTDKIMAKVDTKNESPTWSLIKLMYNYGIALLAKEDEGNNPWIKAYQKEVKVSVNNSYINHAIRDSVGVTDKDATMSSMLLDTAKGNLIYLYDELTNKSKDILDYKLMIRKFKNNIDRTREAIELYYKKEIELITKDLDDNELNLLTDIIMYADTKSLNDIKVINDTIKIDNYLSFIKDDNQIDSVIDILSKEQDINIKTEKIAENASFILNGSISGKDYNDNSFKSKSFSINGLTKKDIGRSVITTLLALKQIPLNTRNNLKISSTNFDKLINTSLLYENELYALNRTNTTVDKGAKGKYYARQFQGHKFIYSLKSNTDKIKQLNKSNKFAVNKHIKTVPNPFEPSDPIEVYLVPYDETSFIQGILTYGNKDKSNSLGSIFRQLYPSNEGIPLEAFTIAKDKAKNLSEFSPVYSSNYKDMRVQDYELKAFTHNELNEMFGKSKKITDVLPEAFGMLKEIKQSSENNIKALETVIKDSLKNKNDKDYIAVNFKEDRFSYLWALLTPEVKNYLTSKNKTTIYIKKEVFRYLFGMGKGFSITRVIGLPDKFKSTLGFAEEVYTSFIKLVKHDITIKTPSVFMNNITSNLNLLWIKGVPMEYLMESIPIIEDYLSKTKRLRILQSKRYIIGNDSSVVNEYNTVKHELEKNPLHNMVEQGLINFITEDSSIGDVHKDKNIITKKFSKQIEKASSYKAIKELYALDGSESLRVMQSFVQYGDVMARYALQKHLSIQVDNSKVDKLTINKINVLLGKDGKKLAHGITIEQFNKQIPQMILDNSTNYGLVTTLNSLHNKVDIYMNGIKEDIKNEVLRTFVTYDLPVTKTAEFLDRYGLALFHKFAIRIQSIIFSLFSEAPARTLVSTMLQNLIGNISDVTDSQFDILPNSMNALDGMEVLLTPPVLEF